MNRRRFVSASAALGMISVTPSALSSNRSSADLLGNPEAAVGQKFLVQGGGYLTLVTAKAVEGSEKWDQWMLEFETDRALPEGTHDLCCRSGNHQQIFLQGKDSKAWAFVSRRA